METFCEDSEAEENHFQMENLKRWNHTKNELK